MKQYVIIAAGGIGTRMGSILPKQLLLLHNKPIIVHTIERFCKALPEAEIIVAVPTDYIEELKKIFSSFEINCTIVGGGATRFHSVKNALDTINTKGVVLVHDAARCLVPETTIIACCEMAQEIGNAIPVVDCTDSVRWISGNENKILDRKHVKLVQTPQAFLIDTLKAAFEQPYNDLFTDEASVVEAYGCTINTVAGSAQNIKVTNPIDLQIASLYLNT